MSEDSVHLLDILRSYPKLLPRVVKALLLDVFDLIHGRFLLVSPLELLVQEVEDDEVERPEVISSREVDAIVGIQRCKRYGSPEVGLVALFDRVTSIVQVLLGEAKVHNEDLLVVLGQHEVRLEPVRGARSYGLDVAMDETSAVHLFDGVEHLYLGRSEWMKIPYHELDGNLDVVTLFQALANLGQIVPFRVRERDCYLGDP